MLVLALLSVPVVGVGVGVGVCDFVEFMRILKFQ
jgi:hypothetical protein